MTTTTRPPPRAGPRRSRRRTSARAWIGGSLRDREAVSDEMRALIEELWPELVHKLP
jgi:hypothetical protein